MTEQVLSENMLSAAPSVTRRRVVTGSEDQTRFSITSILQISPSAIQWTAFHAGLA